ncbi:MAG: hypothetical protein SFV53_06660 [Rickettsiales bacterium]|nr:hypothetical protein [Rickettsiales bacterium]
MKNQNLSRITYDPRKIVGSGGNYSGYLRLQPKQEDRDERDAIIKITSAMCGTFMELPIKALPDFTQELLQVRRNINSLEKELQLATDRKSVKKILEKYSLEYEDINIAKQKLSPKLAQECIENCFKKFREDVKNYRFAVLSKKNFLPKIKENEKESYSEGESSTKWRDRFGSKK